MKLSEYFSRPDWIHTVTDSYKKWVLFCFFLSGMTALVYELVWTRWLVFIFGNKYFD